MHCTSGKKKTYELDIYPLTIAHTLKICDVTQKQKSEPL
jgi:hypothetical protein